MPVHLRFQDLKQSRWTEHAVRFSLGGLATVLAGAVASFFGPETGGLFLAFPAIFCASATLIEKHERKRKQQKGLHGTRRGQQAAALDSVGAVWGSVGLATFGVCVWLLAETSPVLSLVTASVVWLVVACAMWWLRRLLRVAHRPRAGHVGLAGGRSPHK
jgi:Flp pilus assembly protein TadB